MAHGSNTSKPFAAMKGSRFAFGGVMRSYWDFYVGYGLEAAAVCIVEAALLAVLANIAVAQPMPARPMIALFVLANLGHALLTARYFFPLPVVFDLLIAACLAWAFVATGRA